FKSAESLRQIVRTMPRDRLVLETDAPYLAPHPYRGKRNEPAYLPLIARQVAELWGTSLESLAEQTHANTRRLFPRIG
ncbi:MAG: TatD family hydrolase, partial [Fimbriimonadales bacterium]